ncbi:MAG: DNRLRE domain-containing protein [Deltaproteobacteria bacterium]|nr:DNRLRE domain-containing protein [Deltaproteobacteria bacterium]
MIPCNNYFISSSTRRILWIWFLAGISFLLLPITSSFGRDVSFVWTANTGTIDGYKLYYKTGTSGAPYDGTGATEGPSPVTTGNVTSFTLHGLSDTETYYFTLTAYVGSLESGYATEVVVPPVSANSPPTASGATISTKENSPITGQLSANDPDGDALTYSIVTNGNLGSVVINNQATGAFTYTPNTDATGNDSFSFKVNDGTVDSNTATVNVTILPASTVTKIFGDTPDADYPGTLADTYTNLNNNINAAAATLTTYSWSSPAPHKVANTIIIKADLASIPSAAIIQEARIYLYQTGANGEAEYNNSIHMITGKDPQIDQVSGYNAYNGEPWTPVPANTTYNDVPLGLADIGPQEDTVQLNTQNGYRSWLVTKMVQKWVSDPSTNHGLLIKGETTAIETGRDFAASENQDAAIRPKLVIRYTLHKAPKLILIKEIK